MKDPMGEKKFGWGIRKEVIVGLLCLGLGGYSILYQFNVFSYRFTLPQLVANILLTLAGIFLLTQAYRLATHNFFRHRLFK